MLHSLGRQGAEF